MLRLSQGSTDRPISRKMYWCLIKAVSGSLVCIIVGLVVKNWVEAGGILFAINVREKAPKQLKWDRFSLPVVGRLEEGFQWGNDWASVSQSQSDLKSISLKTLNQPLGWLILTVDFVHSMLPNWKNREFVDFYWLVLSRGWRKTTWLIMAVNVRVRWCPPRTPLYRSYPKILRKVQKEIFLLFSDRSDEFKWLFKLVGQRIAPFLWVLKCHALRTHEKLNFLFSCRKISLENLLYQSSAAKGMTLTVWVIPYESTNHFEH